FGQPRFESCRRRIAPHRANWLERESWRRFSRRVPIRRGLVLLQTCVRCAPTVPSRASRFFETPWTLVPGRDLRPAPVSPRQKTWRTAIPLLCKNSGWADSLLSCLQNLFERALLFLVHRQQLAAQLRVRGI